jgi:predicted secreted protein
MGLLFAFNIEGLFEYSHADGVMLLLVSVCPIVYVQNGQKTRSAIAERPQSGFQWEVQEHRSPLKLKNSEDVA